MTGPQDESAQGPHEGAGSLADEAARLLAALQGLARDQATGASAAAGGAAGLWEGLNEHLAAGEDCRYCPLCQLIRLVRQTSPEVRQHLSAAVGSFAAAVASALATRPPGQEPSGSPVQKIDLDDEDS